MHGALDASTDGDELRANQGKASLLKVKAHYVEAVPKCDIIENRRILESNGDRPYVIRILRIYNWKIACLVQRKMEVQNN